MAHKKSRSIAVSRPRTVVKTVTKKSKSSHGGSLMNKAVMGAVYGGVRRPISDALQPLASKVPFGEYADEALMLGLSYFAAKGQFGNGFIKDVGIAGLYIESAVIGSSVTRGLVSNKKSVSNTVDSF